MTGKTYTRNEVLRAVNDGADLVSAGLDLVEHDIDLINLVVNAALSKLDDPVIDLDGVMDENYSGGAEEVRSWWSHWN